METSASIMAFLQGDEANIRARAKQVVQRLFPSPEGSLPVDTPEVDYQSREAGLGPVTHSRLDERLIDPVSLTYALALAFRTQLHPGAAAPLPHPPRETTMANLRDNLRAYEVSHESADYLRPCPLARDCMFSWAANSMSHPLAPDSKKVGISFLFEDEWGTPPDKVTLRPCVICQLHKVNFMAACAPVKAMSAHGAGGGSAASTGKGQQPQQQQQQTLAVLNLFYVALERAGEFCTDACIFSPLITGPFPRFETTLLIPAAATRLDNHGRPLHMEEIGGNNAPAVGDRSDSSSSSSSSRPQQHQPVAAFLVAWRGFHSRGRQPEITPLRSDKFVLEVPKTGVFTSQGRLPRSTSSSVNTTTTGGFHLAMSSLPKADDDREFIQHLARLDFQTLVNQVRVLGYPCGCSWTVQASVVLYPQVTVIPFTPPSKKVYQEYFLGANFGEIQLLQGLAYLYPHHGVPSAADCRVSSVYWACMTRANLLARLAYSEPSAAGSWRRDHLITLLEAMTPLMGYLRTHFARVGNRVPLDTELAEANWRPLSPEFVRPGGAADVIMPPEEDLINIRSTGIRNVVMGDSGRRSFRPFNPAKERALTGGRLRSYYQLADELFSLRPMLVDEQEEWLAEDRYTTIRLLLRYFTEAGAEEETPGTLAARRMACVPLLAHLHCAAHSHGSPQILENRALQRTSIDPFDNSSNGATATAENETATTMTVTSLLSLFPVSWNRGLWCEDALPNYGHEILRVLVTNNVGPGMVIQEGVPEVGHLVGELYQVLLFSPGIVPVETPAPSPVELMFQKMRAALGLQHKKHHHQQQATAATFVAVSRAGKAVLETLKALFQDPAAASSSSSSHHPQKRHRAMLSSSSGVTSEAQKSTVLQWLRKILGCLLCGSFTCQSQQLPGAGNLSRITRFYASLTSPQFDLVARLQELPHLLVVAMLLYLQAVARVRPAVMGPLGELFENAPEIIGVMVEVARRLMTTPVNQGTPEGNTIREMEARCQLELDAVFKERAAATASVGNTVARNWFRRRVRLSVMIHHLNAQLGEACLVKGGGGDNNDGALAASLPHASHLQKCHERGLELADAFQDLVSGLEEDENGGGAYASGVLVLVGITEAVFGAHAARAVLAFGRSEAILALVTSDPPNHIIVNQEVTALIQALTTPFTGVGSGGGNNDLVAFRLFIEHLHCRLTGSFWLFEHGGPTSRMALSQQGDYAHRGLQGIVKDALVNNDVSTRIPLLALTEENAKIHNYRRFIGGLRQINQETGKPGLSVLNIRSNGKPSLRKLRLFVHTLKPRLVKLPGRVLVFPKVQYSFRRNQKAMDQANLIGRMLRTERDQLISSIAKDSATGKSLVGGVALDVPDHVMAQVPWDFKVRVPPLPTQCYYL